MKWKDEFGVVGLGRMGGNLSLQALEKKIKVVGYTPEGASKELLKANLIEIKSLKEFLTNLKSPRAIFIYIPAGPDLDDLLDELSINLEKGDIIVDGGNSYWGDSIRRYQRLKKRKIQFVDLGTSGGVDGARNGACFMAGGDKIAIHRIESLLKTLSVKDGFIHAGPPGAGHFVKLVHNGIEFGMLQAIGEGIDLLEHYRDRLHIADILKCWQNGSVIRSWLVDLMEKSYRKENGMEHIPSYIEDTGEVNWLVNDAIRMEVSIPVISQSVMQLFASRDNKKHWARAIAMMRHEFGGHPFGVDNAIKKERLEGKIGDFYREK